MTKKATPAAAAKPATGTAVTVMKARNVVSIKEQLAAQVAANQGKTAPPSGTKIRVTQDKMFLLPDGTKTPGPLHATILDFCTTHDYYPGKFDKKNIAPPICFAIGPDPKNMTPSDNSPNKQCDNCQACAHNQFPDAGGPKACKNGRVLALLPASDDGTDVDHEADIWTLDVSPTALKAFDGYVQGLARTFGNPPVAFLTEISFNPAIEYPQLQFDNPRPIKSVGEAMGRQAEAAELINVEPDVKGYAAKQAAAPASKRAPQRAAGRR